jgi:hypothetical protein
MFVCADCRPGVVTGKVVQFVCHHCGKPLCDEHRRWGWNDPAFSGVGASTAVH